MKTKQIDALSHDDMVLGTDDAWHTQKPLETEYKDLYHFITSRGSVICSYDHHWIVYKKEKRLGKRFFYDISTIELHNQIDKFKGLHIGTPHGPRLVDIKYHGQGKCRCLTVDNSDHQFAILTDKGKKIYTRNCGGRMICGYVDSTASMMALDNSMGTTIKGEHKGAGIYAVGKEMTNIQFYYADQSWIKDWYKARGLDDKGYPQIQDEKREYELGADGEEITLNQDNISYEFEEEKKEINNQKEQKFENISQE